VALFFTAYAGLATRYWLRPSFATLVAFSLVQCLIALVRPEGFYILLFSAIYSAFVFVFQGPRRELLIAVALPALFWLALTCARYVWFGMLFPNPVYAKSGDLSEALTTGATYLLQFVSTNWLTVVETALLGVLGLFYSARLVVTWRKRKGSGASAELNLLFVFGLCVTALLFVLVSGGDWMGRSRFVTPIMPCLAIVTMAHLFYAMGRMQRWVRRPFLKAGIALLTLVCAGSLIWSQATERGIDLLKMAGIAKLRQPDLDFQMQFPLREIFASWTEVDEKFIESSRVFRREATSSAPLFDTIIPALYKERGRLTLIAGQMGYFPYALKKRFPDEDIYIIDLHGLASREIAHMGLPRNLGGARGGNLRDIFEETDSELSQYIRSKDPDIIYVRNMTKAEERAVENAGFTIVTPKCNVAYRPTGNPGVDSALEDKVIGSNRKRRQP
jgi:hypothetical protein